HGYATAADAARVPVPGRGARPGRFVGGRARRLGHGRRLQRLWPEAVLHPDAGDADARGDGAGHRCRRAVGGCTRIARLAHGSGGGDPPWLTRARCCAWTACASPTTSAAQTKWKCCTAWTCAWIARTSPRWSALPVRARAPCST